MENNISPGEINMSKIPVSADVPGLLFTIGTVVTFYWGIPELRYILPAAIVVGVVVALVLRCVRHESRPVSYIPH